MEEIFDLIEEGREHYGSQTLDQHLADLVRGGAVDFDVAKAAANNPADFDLKMNMLGDSLGSRGVSGTSGLEEEMTRFGGG
jgi:twitching motility protein PilT